MLLRLWHALAVAVLTLLLVCYAVQTPGLMNGVPCDAVIVHGRENAAWFPDTVQEKVHPGDAKGLWQSWHSPSTRRNPKQNPAWVRGAIVHRNLAFQFLPGGGGPIVLPRHKLLVCVPPKNSCTTVKRLLLRLQGVVTPTEMCHETTTFKNPVNMVHRPLPSPLRQTEKDWPMHYRMAWSDAFWIRDAKNDELAGMFLSPEWTTIAITRDPWERAVSVYNDQRARSKSTDVGWKENLALSPRENFVNFTVARMGDGHHTAEQSSMCGFTYVKYDYVIPLEHLSSGFDTLVRHGVIPASLVYSGWENCTAGGAPGIFESRAVTHGNHIHKSNPHDIHQDDVCDEETVKAVYDRYQADYTAFQTMDLPYEVPNCTKGVAAR